MIKMLRRQPGQTLIEVVVTIGVALVIIGSLVTLINASNRRSTLARQATQASKLAQEGMEIVRHIRDVNATGPGAVRASNLSGPSPCNGGPSYCNFTDLYSAAQDDITVRLLSPNDSTNYSCLGMPSWCLVNDNPTTATDDKTLLGIFSRTVVISTNPISAGGPICSNVGGPGNYLTSAQTKRVTVTVTWDSPIGSQERSATTCFTKWQQ